jgi:hypothetical protein
MDIRKRYTLLICIFALIYVGLTPNPIVFAQANTATLMTDKAIYPIWHMGGAINVTAGQLSPNTTYYLWMQKPTDVLSHGVGVSFRSVNGTAPSPFSVNITPNDPAGTYSLSLSKSANNDTRDATINFGVFGTNATTYRRTQEIEIAGGGFLPNSTISLELRSGNNSFPGFPMNMQLKEKGEFDYILKIPTSAKTGPLNLTANGRTFNGNRSIRVDTQVSIEVSPILIKPVQAPSSIVERTNAASIAYQLTYPDGSPVTTSTRGTAITVASDQPRTSQIPLLVSDPATGIWKATWVPPPSTNLSRYHFEFVPANFSDTYGNIGVGSRIVSESFQVTSASIVLPVVGDSTFQRTQEAVFVIPARYHNGNAFTNITGTRFEVNNPFGARASLQMSFNGSAYVGRIKFPVNATLGIWNLQASVRDVYGNAGSGAFDFQITRAILRFGVDYPRAVERTTRLNVTARITYPDGSPIASGVTFTISVGNLTFTPLMRFNATAGAWRGNYHIGQNATLGQYNLTLIARDPDGNAGRFTALSQVVPAVFIFVLPSKGSTGDSLSSFKLALYVKYPNGTLLNNRVGTVNATYPLNSTITKRVPLAFNRTDGRWDMFFTTPEGGDITFSFLAKDRYGNSGQAANAYSLKVTPSQRLITQRLLLAGIIGILIPVGLLAWAIITVSNKRRKHRP